jgi:hypothetical protein
MNDNLKKQVIKCGSCKTSMTSDLWENHAKKCWKKNGEPLFLAFKLCMLSINRPVDCSDRIDTIFHAFQLSVKGKE